MLGPCFHVGPFGKTGTATFGNPFGLGSSDV